MNREEPGKGNAAGGPAALCRTVLKSSRDPKSLNFISTDCKRDRLGVSTMPCGQGFQRIHWDQVLPIPRPEKGEDFLLQRGIKRLLDKRDLSQSGEFVSVGVNGTRQEGCWGGGRLTKSKVASIQDWGLPKHYDQGYTHCPTEGKITSKEGGDYVRGGDQDTILVLYWEGQRTNVWGS